MTRRLRRILWSTLAVVTALFVMSFSILPTRQYFDQREIEIELTNQLAALKADAVELEAQLLRLNSMEEIERIARTKHYVRPLEEAYSVVAPESTASKVPAVWPC